MSEAYKLLITTTISDSSGVSVTTVVMAFHTAQDANDAYNKLLRSPFESRYSMSRYVEKMY